MKYTTPKVPRIVITAKDHKKLYALAKKHKMSQKQIISNLLKNVK